ncbi:MAG: BtpA/SgcQ family protein [Patescibacteria group bacterium]|jgi:hypothetical protein
MNSLQSIFHKKRNIVIGAIHFPPLLGYDDFPGFSVAQKNADHDLRAFEKGGVDATIIENNYDEPHMINVSAGTIACMARLGSVLQRKSLKPMGVSVLWNDASASFSVAKTIGGRFIRVPVFVDTVRTSCGIIRGNPKEVIQVRKNYRAQDVLILADIHVKHSRLLSRYSLTQSAQRALQFGADGIIVTGNWTGEPPKAEDLKVVRKAIGPSKALLVGSGVDRFNIAGVFKYANAVIISTSLKQGLKVLGKGNVTKWTQRISESRVKALIGSAR